VLPTGLTLQDKDSDTIEKHNTEGIVNQLCHPIPNAASGELNSVIQSLKYAASLLLNVQSFRTKILLCLSKFDLAPQKFTTRFFSLRP
jgi:hypothetical protein